MAKEAENLNKVVLGITPARGGSKGIPRKNIKLLNGLPLVAHTIGHAMQSNLITDYLVNSEDAEIRSIAESYGAETMDRPEEYSHDAILQEVDLLLQWTVERFEEMKGKSVDVVVLLYPTAPLRDVASIDRAIELIVNEGCDSSVGVYHDTRYLWEKTSDETIAPTNYNPNMRMPRQKENWNQWAENKAVYAMTRDVLFNKGRIGDRCGFVEMEKHRSVDIDEPIDFLMAEALIKVINE